MALAIITAQAYSITLALDDNALAAGYVKW
jgi:hypothetical protein